MHFLFAILISMVGIVVGAPSNSLIVGGNDTTIEEYPHQVSLEDQGWHICGGSIINKRHVVTATHCVQRAIAKYLSVRVGFTSRKNDKGIEFEVESVKFNHGILRIVDGDVAVLKLKEPITFGPKAQPIALVAENNEPRPGELLNVTGWGTTSSTRSSDILQVVQVPAVDQELCRVAYASMGYNITERMICAGVAKKDSCQGDSGGPLINSKKELVGIVSWGNGCGKPGYPGVYTNLANPAMRKFIIENSEE